MSDPSRRSVRCSAAEPALAVAIVAVVLGLTACAAAPAEVPADAVLRPGTSGPAATTQAPPAASGAGEELTRLITLCLARYGLGARPSLPDEADSSEARLLAQQELDAYERILTDCSAEALGTSAPTPSSSTVS